MFIRNNHFLVDKKLNKLNMFVIEYKKWDKFCEDFKSGYKHVKGGFTLGLF